MNFALLAQTATPWFDDPNMVGAILGSFIGLLGAIDGAMGGLLAPRGLAKGLVMTFHVLSVLLGAALIVVGLVALTSGQPHMVWWSLLLPGVLAFGLFGGLTPVLILRYREAECRRLQAEEFRTS